MRPEQIDESELKLDPNNARSHEKGIPELTRSLEAFGQVKPLVVWGDNVVIAGNGTLTAARQMGKTKLWIVRVPEDWDYNKARAFALADNATGDLSTWSLPQLDSTRWELDAEGWDVSGFGFEPLRPPPTPLLAAPDDVPPLPAIPTTKLGDLIILGRHRLVCGDATTNKAYDRVLEDEFVDAVWTDPPYNVGYVGGTDDHLTIAGDRQSDAAFRAFLTAAFHEMWNHAKPGAAIYVCHSDTGGGTFRQAMTDESWMLKQCLIWAKNTFVMGRQDYHWQHEPILYGWKPGAAHTWHGPRNQATLLDDDLWDGGKGRTKKELLEMLEEIRATSTIVREDKPQRSAEHPTMKPVRLIIRTLENNAAIDSIVLDPFAGSGSTLVACEMMGARARLIEVDPKYCDVVITRWENLTGEKAEYAVPGEDNDGALH